MRGEASMGGAERTRLGKYELVRPLAEGGMARLYLAKSSGIGSFERYLVVKLILRERAGDSNAVKMLLDEARLAATLNHHNVAQVYEVGEEGGLYYLAMEYVHGVDLRALLTACLARFQPLPLPFALTIAASAAAGLHHAHARVGAGGRPLDIVHRDVSPSNIMIAYDGAVKLVDFGLAKAAQRQAETKTGIIKGKIAYLSPEQVRGKPADRRSDVFSLGVVLYEITTMRRAFRGRTDFETMQAVASATIKRPSEIVNGYPPSLEAVVMRALTVDPDARYQTAAEVLAGIEQVAAEQRIALSHVALGHYMHEMFGDVIEPWLRAGDAVPTIPPPPGDEPARERTSSDADADAASETEMTQPRIAAPAALAPVARASKRTGPQVPIPTTAAPPILAAAPGPGDWSPARDYPHASEPALASTRTLPPGTRLRARDSSRHGYDAPRSRTPTAPVVEPRDRRAIAIVIAALVIAALIGAAVAILQARG